MRRAALLVSLTSILAVELWAGSAARIQLRLGEHTTLHVGQIAVLQTGSTHKYDTKLEGDAIAPFDDAQQDRNRHFYRAVHAGNATLLITPADLKEGDCISCVTRHCFISVVP